VIGDRLVGAQATWLGRSCPVGGGEPWSLDTLEFEVGGQVSVLAGAETAGHSRVDLAEITGTDDTKW
jgi:hypothetical protein